MTLSKAEYLELFKVIDCAEQAVLFKCLDNGLSPAESGEVAWKRFVPAWAVLEKLRPVGVDRVFQDSSEQLAVTEGA